MLDQRVKELVNFTLYISAKNDSLYNYYIY